MGHSKIALLLSLSLMTNLGRLQEGAPAAQERGEQGPVSGPALAASFQQVRVPLPCVPSDILVADLDLDGYPDIAVVDRIGKRILTMMGDALMSFSRQYAKSSPEEPWSFIGAADFNGDKKLDLAVKASGGNQYFSIFPGKGNGSLATRRSVKVSAGPLSGSHKILDFNGDGKPDVAAILSDSWESKSYWGAFRNLGGYRFKLSVGEKIGGDSLAAGDFNKDGRGDVVIGSDDTGASYFFKGLGDGTFARPVTTKIGRDLGYSLWSADLNADKKLDLIGEGHSSPKGWVMLGTGNGRFVKRKPLPGSEALIWGQVNGDLTGDRKVDIAAATRDGIKLFAGNGNGTFAALPVLANHLGFNFNWWRSNIGIGDFNKDGRLDLVGTQFRERAQIPMTNLVFFINGPPNTLSISNLSLSRLAYVSGTVLMDGSVSFEDSGGDLRYTGAPETTDNAFLEFTIKLDFPWPMSDYTYNYLVTGPFLNLPDQVAGTINFSLTLSTTVVSTEAPQITLSGFYLWDDELLRSNALN